MDYYRKEMDRHRVKLMALFEEAKTKVDLNCDEHHGHSALNGCISGPKDAVTICEMHEYIERLERLMGEANKSLNRAPLPEEEK